ncbi:hypothetical protein MIN45_P1829 [Methylomarinovum tepidoasis]|uniref:Roadblock/LC7 domain-containing protein n=1 Tax=Methylomarinovum tepidoasis TaxID=2840183 RepID=A0AAU9CC04_9GAMM|nr:hypothetical protein [Methylomarinovum sp. IN45]BCX89456.1 hypothetical protein MIN45_P1829 [Methylomarinovum sp. IN45]
MLEKEISYALPTPAGAYYAVSTAESDPPRRLLRLLLSQTESPRLSPEKLPQGCDRECFERIQRMGWLQWLAEPLTVMEQPLETILPELLAPLSDGGKVLLADAQGFYIGSNGFPHETAEELAALSADFLGLQQRYRGVLQGNLHLNAEAWGIVDAGGHTRLGVWPLHIGKHIFALVMTGIPHFNHPDFVQLVWTLMTRYAPASIVL